MVVLKWIKSIWLVFWGVALTLILFLPIVVCALMGRRGDAAFHGTQVYAWVILKVAGVRLRVRGRENIRPGQRYVILSNHTSYFDPPALVLSLGLQYRWVIKKELRKVPLFGLALATSRNLFIDRSKGSDAMRSIQEGVAQLPDGTGVLLFPEGTRSRDGQVAPFKKGGFVIASDSGLPILPVTINGSHERLPKGTAAFRPGEIEVVIHPPVETSGRTVEELMSTVHKQVAEARRTL
ncbi:lysophospholipid acyltransferase family protein [Tamilnaduibacter salinus]|uniref:lysophospholipid acyltransferase family protein n=1 Tax=Tamilnaduibacter salinus TaxID=1484056 RepID=UPI001D176930|nr:lysophospholipid acyltransferase family protein [Tamilnaduibacter salinus]